MEIRETELSGVFEITLSPITDERGFFMRTYDISSFEQNGLCTTWLQENHSRSERKGIIRGLHFQVEPFHETKLVRCISGSVWDVAVDLRPESATFGRWISCILSAENRKMLYIPRGFAHGFCTLTSVSEVIYKVDNIYSPFHERGIIWNDAEIGIEWPVSFPVLSEKDRNNMSFKDYKSSLLK